MRIQSITVNNYRSFSENDNTLQVNPGVTTIIGMNGSGKTNIINAIGLIDLVNGINLQTHQQDRNRFHDNPISISVKLAPLETEDSSILGSEATVILIKEPDTYEISGGIADVFQAKLESYDTVITALNESSFVNGNAKPAIMSRAKSINHFRKMSLGRTNNCLSALIRDFDDLLGCEKKDELLSYVRDLQVTIQTIINSIPIIFKHDDGKTLKDSYAVDELRPLSGKTNDPSVDNKPNDLFRYLLQIAQIDRNEIVDAIDKNSSPLKHIAVERANPKIETEVMAKFRQFYKKDTEKLTLTVRIDNNTLHLTFSTGYAATEFSERSNGLRWYFKMFIDLMRCIDGERPVVYVLDEPGIHLHINAQDELKHLFFEQASHGSQIIYTTHSPYMIDENLGSLRSITKSEDSTFSCIHNSLYSTALTGPHTLDTLSPVAAALGMDLKLTPGLSPEKLNVIVEGITDQIYLNTMAKVLGIDVEKISIIPSTGAQNIKHLCSILMGWGFKFLAVFDYDKEGIRCAKDLKRDLNLEFGGNFMLLKDVREDELYDSSAVDRSEYVIIERMIDDIDRDKFSIDPDGDQQQKKITAVRFSSAVQNGNDLSVGTKQSFSALFNRILSHV